MVSPERSFMTMEKYRPEFCQMLIDHMSQSKSYDSFPAAVYKKYKIHIGLTTMYDWEKRHQEWAEAKETAKCLSLDFMESRAAAKMSGQKIEGINAKDIDAYVLMGMLKTRFYKIYGDKVQHDISDDTKQAIKLKYKLDEQLNTDN